MSKAIQANAIDLFCGCGGISSGLRDAGFSILAGSDIEANYICTFKRNFPEAKAITEDLVLLNPEVLMSELGMRRGELDLLAGGPPCQGFSKNVPRRNRYLDLPNNRLVRRFLEYVEAFSPKVVLMENVAEMKNGFGQAYTREIVQKLTTDGYSVQYQVLNAADFGVPQKRRRAFFLAHRLSKALTFPEPTHKLDKETSLESLFPHLSRRGHVSVWEAIGDLPSVEHTNSNQTHNYACAAFTDFQAMMRGHSESVLNHKPRPLADRQYQRLKALSPGQGLKDLPADLRPRSGYSGAYGRLTDDMVAPTITRWVFHPGSGRYGHPRDTRVITIREAARLQSFPDSFEFVGTYTQQAGQIGNAVPPLLINKIATEIMKVVAP